MNFLSSKKLCDYVWINGQIIKWEEANTPISTHSLHYAGAVFEGERAYDGKIFKLQEHSQRLLESARLMHLKINYSAVEISQATIDILQKNNLKNSYIRPFIYRGAGKISVYSHDLSTNLVIFAVESNPSFKAPMRLALSPWKKPEQDVIPAQSKSSAHYQMLSISKQIAQDAGFDDSLILDGYNNIAECSTSNIFFCKGNKIITPIADRFLNGITRQTVIELAKNIGFEVHEARLTLNDLSDYTGCFVTGTSIEIRGVHEICTASDSLLFKNESVIDQLQNAYAKLVGKV